MTSEWKEKTHAKKQTWPIWLRWMRMQMKKMKKVRQDLELSEFLKKKLACDCAESVSTMIEKSLASAVVEMKLLMKRKELFSDVVMKSTKF